MVVPFCNSKGPRRLRISFATVCRNTDEWLSCLMHSFCSNFDGVSKEYLTVKYGTRKVNNLEIHSRYSTGETKNLLLFYVCLICIVRVKNSLDLCS